MEVPGERLPGARMVGGGRGEAGGGAEGATSKGSQAHSVAYWESISRHVKESNPVRVNLSCYNAK